MQRKNITERKEELLFRALGRPFQQYRAPDGICWVSKVGRVWKI